MTLATIIETLKMIALKHPNVNSAYEGNIYDILNSNPNNKYASVVITQQSHTTDEVYDHYGFVIFYVDRLVDDMEDNRVQIQSCGKSMLGNIITFFCEEFDAECENISFQPFTQRFVDETAGIYSTITIDVPKDVICPEEYWKEDWVAPVTVIRNQDKRVVFTENGTYTIDYDPTIYTGLGNVEVNVNIDVDSYYNNGYNQGQADLAANARVLDVTENGVYQSKFSDKTLLTEPTGIYENGDLFFDYAYLNNIQYNTNIYPMSNTKIEIWWKYDGSNEGNEGCIIGCQNWGYINSIFKIGWNFGDNRLLASINDDKIFIPFIEGWNHIVMSYADGLWLNGVKIGAFPSNITDDMGNKEPICINGYYGNSRMNSDYFGMVKINDVVFIPTENGFLNTSTNELLPIRREGEYTYTSVVPEYDEPTGELYKTINVNVIPKINLQKTGLKLGFSSFTEVPEWADFEGITDMNHMFYNCGNLQSIPEINTSNVKDMSYMLTECRKLTTVPTFDTSNVTNFQYCFHNSKIIELPQFDLRKGTNFYEFCYNCYDLKYVPNLDLSSATNISGLLENCNSLISVGELKVPNVRGRVTYFLGGSNKNNLTDFGGLIGFRGSITTDGFHTCPNLSYQSCINILNGLYDFSGNGETPNSDEGKLKVAQSFIDKVGDEISIATNKGWVISV